MSLRTLLGALLSILAVAGAGACTGDKCPEEDEAGHEQADEGCDAHATEIISRVQLTFTPDDGGDPVVAAFEDPDGDGGTSGTFDEIELQVGTTYTLTIALINTLADPPEDITEEVEDEAEEHLFIIYGDAVSGPGSTEGTLVTHTYADVESDYGNNDVGDDLPLGIVNTITANETGDGHFAVMLRHLPELNDSPQKEAGLPEDFASGASLPGDVDVDLEFDLHVID
jgi:hypothetical protein